jgi:hypothetical protein
MKLSRRSIERLLAYAESGASLLNAPAGAEARLFLKRARGALLPAARVVGSPRNKGARGERDAILYLREQGFEGDLKRGLQSRGGGKEQPDVMNVGCLHVETKRVEKLNIHSALQQACDDCSEGKIPIVLHRRNHEGWKVTLRGDDFFRIFRESEFMEGESKQKTWTCPDCLTEHEVPDGLIGFTPKKDCQVCGLVP